MAGLLDDPDEIVYRGSVLPLAKTRGGDVKFAMPGLLEGLLGAAALPGDVARGKTPMRVTAPETGEPVINPDVVGRSADLAGAAMTGLMPIASKNVASKSAMLYDPSRKPPRPIEADYPAGAPVDATGRITRTIDGDPVTGKYVVGRAQDRGGELALPREAYDEIAEAITGQGIVAVPASSIRGDGGQLSFDRRSGRPLSARVSQELRPDQFDKVAAHEVGHLLDVDSNSIKTDGLSAQFRSIYNDLNNPQRHGRAYGPEHAGYPKGDVRDELVAEAIRAYMADPNYIKTVSPDVAKAIRAAVNRNPKINHLIQFNSVPGLLGAGALGASTFTGNSQPPEN